MPIIYSAACGSGSAALATQRIECRLAAILAADIAGYSRLMGAAAILATGRRIA
jgi:class 3 adenylate cyclase